MDVNRSSTPGLGGIRVLEIGHSVAAPYAAGLLAAMGADVIKVESPQGDPIRRRGPFSPTLGHDLDGGGLFLALNADKQSIVVEPGDTETVAPLLARADIVVTDLGTEELTGYGIDPAAVLDQRPELVLCCITPVGLTGPHAGYEAEELTVAHGGGWAYQSPGALDDPDLPRSRCSDTSPRSTPAPWPPPLPSPPTAEPCGPGSVT